MTVAILDSNRQNRHDSLGFLFNVIVYTKIAAASGKEVTLLDSQTGKPVTTIEASPGRLRFLPDGRLICRDQNDVELWDVKGKKRIWQLEGASTFHSSALRT